MKRIEGESIVLRDLMPSDAAGYASLCADPALRRVLTEWEDPLEGESLPALEDLIAQAQAASDWRAPRRLAIALRGTDEIVGLVGVGEHPDLFETELVYGLLDACRGRGLHQGGGDPRLRRVPALRGPALSDPDRRGRRRPRLPRGGEVRLPALRAARARRPPPDRHARRGLRLFPQILTKKEGFASGEAHL